MHMLFKIKSNPMHPLSDALVAHRHSFALPRCRISQYRRTFVLSQCLFGTILVTLCLMVWDWRVLRAEPMLSCCRNLLIRFVSYYFLFFFLPWVCCLRIDKVFSLSLDLALLTKF